MDVRTSVYRESNVLLSRLIIFLVCLFFLPAASSAAVNLPSQPATAIPAEFGEVIFEIPGKSDRHLFIVGHSHRSARTGANGANTVQAQAEVYRIGEWLIQREGVRLLLPEGFFRKKTAAAPVKDAGSNRPQLVKGTSIDTQTLVEKLSDTSVFVNADMLLKANYSIQLHQVEDQKVYQAVGEFLRLTEDLRESEMMGLVGMELDFLQEVRSAAMLQNIPDAVEYEFALGNIDDRRAIFTIGMAHVDEIIRFLREGRIELAPPALTYATYENHSALLKLVEAGYGVTVILPRSLVDNQEALRMANLNSI